MRRFFIMLTHESGQKIRLNFDQLLAYHPEEREMDENTKMFGTRIYSTGGIPSFWVFESTPLVDIVVNEIGGAQ
jgi:hypothetical protein